MSIPFEPIRERITSILLLTPEEDMYADILDLLLDCFSSEFGYFGYINTAGDLVCPSMTRHIFPACQVSDKHIVFPRSIWGGLWGRILTEKRALTKNDAHEVPDGHLPIRRSFGVPILYHGQLIGLFHLANSQSDYGSQDIALLQQIADFIAPVLNARLRRDEECLARKQAEEQLRVANAELRESQLTLEQRVEERTAELRRANSDLRAINKELEEFAYVTSHDLQEPLRTVVGYLQLLQRRYGGELDDRADEFIEFAIEGAQRMHALIESLLEYSRVTTKTREQIRVPLDEVIVEVRQLMSASLQESRAEIAYEELPVIRADRLQMRQLFQNLISNSIKFRGERTPHIQITSEPAGAMYEIAVADRGVGFDSKHANRVFQVFKRLQRTHPGTGIGLAICKKIVEHHGGEITADAVRGRGATFRFTLPAWREPSEPQ